MSDPFVRKINWLRFFLIGTAVGVTAFVIVVIVGIVVINFSNYQDSGGLSSEVGQTAQVSIGNPANGVQLEANESIMVNATAVGPKAFLSMELWVDGQLAGVQAAPSGGVHPFSTFFYWSPKQPGSHSLLALAIEADGNKAISSQVVVFVTPDPSAGAATLVDSNASPLVLPAPIGGGYIPPSHPGASDIVSPGEAWSGSPSDWINSLRVDKIPTAPELVATANGCGTELLIHDLSETEEGFIIYREDSFSATWTQISALSANSQSDWISFSDSALPGTSTYYVSAFNSKGEANSNLATVNIDPADCPQELGVTPGYSLKIAQLIPELPAEMSYCYHSTDGINWTRWPQLGFLTPNEEGVITGGPVLQIQSQGIGGEEDMTPRLGVNMECWGWQDGVLVQLGDFFIEGESLDPEYFDPTLVGDPGLQAEVIFEPIEFVGQPSYPEVIGDGVLGQADQPEVTESSDFTSKVSQNQLKTSISPLMPNLWLDSTLDINECMKHLPPQSQNSHGASKYCFVYPKFDPNQGTGAVQPYLIWGLESPRTCLGGTSDDCMSYTELQVLAMQSGGVVGFDLTSMSNSGTFTWSVTEPNLTMFVMPPLSCTGSADYSVRMWYKPGPKSAAVSTETGAQVELGGSDFTQENQAEVQDGAITSEDQPQIQFEGSDFEADGSPQPVVGKVYYSMPSNVVTLPCVPIVGVATPIQYLAIKYHSIFLFEIDDGDFSDYGAPQDV